jgi:hypothetical protein
MRHCQNIADLVACLEFSDPFNTFRLDVLGYTVRLVEAVADPVEAVLAIGPTRR